MNIFKLYRHWKLVLGVLIIAAICLARWRSGPALAVALVIVFVILFKNIPYMSLLNRHARISWGNVLKRTTTSKPYEGYACLYGTESAHLRNADDIHRRQQELVVASAVRHPVGIIFAIAKPGRHHHCISAMVTVDAAGMEYTHDQGFVTSWGRYLDREDSFNVATAANQIIKKSGSLGSDELFSEDVWDSPTR